VRSIFQHLFWCFFIALLFFSCPTGQAASLIELTGSARPRLQDDLDRSSLSQAVGRSLSYLRALPADVTFTMAGRTVGLDQFIRSLAAFQKILQANPTDKELQETVRRDFELFQAAGTRSNPDRDMLVTGYFQPVLEGSLTRTPPYLYPVYSIPEDLVVKTYPGIGKKLIGRLDGGIFFPYWTRQEIEQQNRAAGNELVWLKDPLDVFFLHIQGSGIIRLRDNSLRGIHYAIKNGHPYRSIGKFMVDTGRITLAEASMDSIRRYFNSHPEEQQEILFANPSYIFFNWTDALGAIGNLEQELTPGRSIAVDQSCFPAGGLAFLTTRHPVFEPGTGKFGGWKSISRFVLAQDTGSAIRGTGRVDLFWGAGDQAGEAAGHMKEAGKLYFLLLRGKMP
jgi:membrane-bound lytic murein transglycosylase A